MQALGPEAASSGWLAAELSASNTHLLMLKQDCGNLNHLHKVETRFYCPQMFLYLSFQCGDDVSELKYTFRDCKEQCGRSVGWNWLQVHELAVLTANIEFKVLMGCTWLGSTDTVPCNFRAYWRLAVQSSVIDSPDESQRQKLYVD